MAGIDQMPHIGMFASFVENLSFRQFTFHVTYLSSTCHPMAVCLKRLLHKYLSRWVFWKHVLWGI